MEKYKNRGTYAATAFISTFFAYCFILLLWHEGDIKKITEMFILQNESALGLGFNSLWQFLFTISLPATVSAFLIWPRSQLRHRSQMVACGLAVVGITFIMLTPMAVIYEHQWERLLNLEIFTITISMALLGSIVTLGIPYLLGALLSMWFATAKTVNMDHDST